MEIFILAIALLVGFTFFLCYFLSLTPERVRVGRVMVILAAGVFTELVGLFVLLPALATPGGSGSRQMVTVVVVIAIILALVAFGLLWERFAGPRASGTRGTDLETAG